MFPDLQRLLGGRLRTYPHGASREARVRRGMYIISVVRALYCRLRDPPQKVFDIIHPPRRNLTTIRGYVRLGGLPDNPRTDPQDRSWFGPHDRLFTEEEGEPINFVPGPHNGAHNYSLTALFVVANVARSVVLGLGRRR